MKHYVCQYPGCDNRCNKDCGDGISKTTAFGAFGAGVGSLAGPVGAVVGGFIGAATGILARVADKNCNCTPIIGPLGIQMGGIADCVYFFAPNADFNSLGIDTHKFKDVSFKSVRVNDVVNPDILLRRYDEPYKVDDFITRRPCEKCSRPHRCGYRCKKCYHIYCKACCLE